VHMLSTGAFNALLKILEEPPAHVKFFFATTEPNKIPETVRSRCQRYDFSGITPEQAVATLGEICAMEGVKAEPEALRAIARRGGGSMRDAQSLLEQLLSVNGETLTLELVHKRLGTPSDERVLDLIDALADHDSAAVLRHVEEAASRGVQPADLLNGLLEFLRDVMVLAAGGESVLLAASPRQTPRLQKVVDRLPLDSILAALQILAETRGKLRGGAHGRLLVELALVRVARLENFADVGTLIGRLSALESGRPLPAPPTLEKKKTDPPEPEPARPPTSASPRSVPRAAQAPVKEVPPPPPLTIVDVNNVWPEVLKFVGARLGISLGRGKEFLAVTGPDALALRFPAGYTGIALECDTPEGRAKVEQAFQRLLKRPVTFRLERAAEGSEPEVANPASAPRRRDDLEGDPLVRKVVELFEARLFHQESDDEPGTPSPA
jgi:DNA polymerase III subunit gamma/tau